MRKPSGRLIVISAPSGCGKTTIVERLVKEMPNLVRSVSWTTRKPRASEAEGQDYFFVSAAEFEKKKHAGFFLESAAVFGASYGTPKDFALEQIQRGKKVILAIDVQGMKKVLKNIDPSVPLVSIFIMSPSFDVLRKRLDKRNTESGEEVNRRLRIAKKEIKSRSLYQHTVVNEHLDQAVKEIKEIIQ